MTQVEDRDISQWEQGETFQMKLPGGLWLEMADTWANRRGLMILLRCLRRADGRPLMTYESIAGQLGYADRRNVHNYWMAYEACGEDLGSYLSRKKKVDAGVVALCAQIWKAHPLWSAVQVHEALVGRFPEGASHLSVQNVRTAGHQIGYLGIQSVLKKQLAEGKVHLKEPVLLDALFSLADAGARAQADAAGPVAELPEVLEAVRPQGVDASPGDPSQAATTEALTASLMEGAVSPSLLARLWQGSVGTVMLAFVLYYHGLSLEVIGSFFGVHKTTVMRWLAPLARLNWQGVVQQGKRFFSGVVAVDEKWIRVAGVWWYVFVAVDHVSGFPLHIALFPSNATPYCQAFLLQLKGLGYSPKVIITDGWEAYVASIAAVFPKAQHLLCRFHAVRAALDKLKEAFGNRKVPKALVEGLQGLFHTPSKRTVTRRIAKLQAQAQGTPGEPIIGRLVAKLPKLLPAVGSTFRPSTTNAAEGFLGAFDRFYARKGPFPHPASAHKHIRLFMLGYVFSTLSAQAQQQRQGRCPLQLSGYRVAHLPLFHMINRPDLARLRKHLVEAYAQVA
jgi:transposase-like protein